MRGSLGEKIGEGAAAEVFAWAPGQVVKLFRPATSRRLAWHEIQMTHTAFAAGAPSAEMLGVVTLNGRLGMVLQRFEGPTLVHLLRSGAVTRLRGGAILAELALTVHKLPVPPDVVSLRDWMDAWLRSAGALLPAHINEGVRATIEKLSSVQNPKEAGLCHGDLHPGNVIMTEAGPRLVDWSGSIRAPAVYDLAISHVLLTEYSTEIADDPERPRALDAALQPEYARLAGMPAATLAAEIEPYFSFIRVLIVLGGTVPALRDRLLDRVEAALR
jgi:Ser/Thr protein kinase RdoA (MazF antagonist)